MWKLSKWIFIILVIILTCISGSDWKCPHISQWYFTSKSYGCSDQNNYICLFDALKSNGSKAVFTEKCGHLDLSREGFRYVFTHDLNQVPCSASRYQPFTFTTNGNSQCVLSKSLCISSGQILANNGNSFTDISCRCDYRYNYDYVIPPKNPCACKPAEEDCSCYIRKCEDDKVMIADYRCMKRVDTILPEDIKCPVISRIIPPEETDTVDKIQLQSVVTGSSTLSKQASVILIVVIIIYTGLVGFLFFSVPHITSILLESKLELSVKRRDNEFIILNGDIVTIECYIKSYIPIRSVTWQKEKKGEIIQITPYKEKYEMKIGKRTSLTIHNFNAEDQGKYRCIVRNVVGLRKEVFDSCRNCMSSVGWLTRFVKVLQYIPAFHSEDMMYMKLHTHDFDSQSEPTVYNVYKGDDITMEPHLDNQLKLVAVKWFKENNKWTDMGLIDEQFKGGVPDVPYLTIEKTSEEDDKTMEECCSVQQTLNTVKLVKENDKGTEIGLKEEFRGGVPDIPPHAIKKTSEENDETMEECCYVQQTLNTVELVKENDKETEIGLMKEFRGVVPDEPYLTIEKMSEEDDKTMEECCYVQQTLNTVKLVNKKDKWTKMDLTEEQFDGGVPDVPSLTLKTTRVENAGKYLCLLIYDNRETKMVLFNLRIIPQVKIYKALLDHREHRTFIRPAICDTIDKHIQENDIVVISGREGTGKSKMCLELASRYYEKDYMVFKVDLSENYTTYTDIADALLIIDDQQYTQDSISAFMKHHLPALSERNIKVIVTCRNSDLEVVKRELNTLKDKHDEAFIDINNCLTSEEKEKILRSYMKVNNVASSPSIESNFRNPEIITDLSVQVILDDDAIKVIRNEEPWKGFPLCASLFCSDRKFLHLAEKFFTNPPEYLVEKLRELYKAARNSSHPIDSINDYCILVNIMNNKNHQLDLNDYNTCSQVVGLYQTLFHFKYKPASNDDQKKSIEVAVHRMNNKYLKFQEGVYEFIHPCLLKAMFLSSDSMIPYLIQNGSLHDITEFVRSEDYIALGNELVIKIGEEHHHILCERLARHAFESHSLLQHVVQYIYSYWRSSGNNLVNKMFKHLEFILFRSLEVHTDEILSHDAGSLFENRINFEGSVQFSKIIMLLDELTYKGRDPWIYGPGSADFLVLSALISSAIGRYAINRNHTFTILLKEFQNRINLESFVRLLSKPLDTHGNTFFHYLMLFGEMEATYILNVNEERPKYVLDTENLKKYTPLDIAAFLGKRNILEVLNLMTNFSKKLRDRLKRLAESGKVEYYYENSKHKNIDQPNVHQINDDSDSPKKHEYKDADGVKKGVKDEDKKNKSFFKRKASMRKEEPSEKEKHDKNNVLCFDDFMINIVVLGELEDYKSILELLS